MHRLNEQIISKEVLRVGNDYRSGMMYQDGGQVGGRYSDIANTPSSSSSGTPVVINFTGNVLSDTFIEEEALPKIREAVRRGFEIS